MMRRESSFLSHRLFVDHHTLAVLLICVTNVARLYVYLNERLVVCVCIRARVFRYQLSTWHNGAKSIIITRERETMILQKRWFAAKVSHKLHNPTIIAFRVCGIKHQCCGDAPLSEADYWSGRMLDQKSAAVCAFWVTHTIHRWRKSIQDESR